MKFECIIFFSLLSVSLHSQDSLYYSKLIFTESLQDTFTFQKNWQYPDGIFKDELTGKFDNMYGDKVSNTDTVHLHYTARCTTNIQGGYEINYAYAYQHNDSTMLIYLQDGLPAYASYFDIYINKDSFSFKPKTIYPRHIQGEKILYKVLHQNVNIKKSYIRLGIMLAEIDILFEEIVFIKNKMMAVNQYYLKGTIRTTLKKRVNSLKL